MRTTTLLLHLVAAACNLPCKSNADCFGTTPICELVKCNCAAHDTCVCAAACTSDDDCAPDWFCNDDQMCELREGKSDPDCE